MFLNDQKYLSLFGLLNFRRKIEIWQDKKKCLLLRVCLVKSKLNQYRRCCLNYALLKKRERKIHCSSKSFDFYLEWIWLGSMASWQFGMLWYVCFVAIQGQYSQFSVYFASIRLITLVFCLIWFFWIRPRLFLLPSSEEPVEFPYHLKAKRGEKTGMSGTLSLHVSLPALGYARHLGLVLALWNNGSLSHSQINKISNLPLIGKQTSLFVHRWHLHTDNKSLWAFQFGVSSRNVWKIPGDTFISSELALPLTKSLLDSDDGFKILLLPLR